MNNTLNYLIQEYIGDTGSLMLYYDFNPQSTGIQSYLSANFTTGPINYGGIDISNGSVVDNFANEYFSLISGGSSVGFYSPIGGDAAQEFEDGLDPSDNFSLGVTIDDTILSFQITNTGTIQGVRFFSYNGIGYDENDIAFSQEQLYSGFFLNQSPATTVPRYSGAINLPEKTSNAAISSAITGYVKSDISGADLSQATISFGPFSGDSFLRPDDYDSDVTFLFSTEKTGSEDGIIFGSLRRDQFDNNGETGVYGRGFNIGLNDRNKLFFQGIDSSQGEYVLTANDIELSKKNICSVAVSPYSVTFGYYNLAADSYQEQSLLSNVKIQNTNWDEGFALGSSPTYYKQDRFPGFIDEFAIFSGSYDGATLKSVASGFVATGIGSSGAPSTGIFLTGYQYVPVYPTGITGYGYSVTGYKEVRTTGSFISTSISTSGIWVKEGDRFFTGKSVDGGDYVEEVGFLIKDNIYRTTGNVAHATLGLKEVSGFLSGSSVTYSRTTEDTGYIPLYGVSGLTGFLYENPTGYIKTPLYKTGIISGSESEILDFIDDRIGFYRSDYLYYLGDRV